MESLQKELEALQYQLAEANEIIEAIRNGQIDALVAPGNGRHQFYTLKSADRAYRVFIETMTEGAVTLSSEGLILYCNSRFAMMVRLPLSKVIGLPFEAFIAPENKVQYDALFKKSWEKNCKGEVQLIAGEVRKPVQLSLTTLYLEEGASLNIILTDLTAQKAAQQQLKLNNEQLEALNRALESSNHDLLQFASVASHDLQEPLRKILVFSLLLKEKQTELTPESIKYVDKIIASSRRMKTLILDILDYSKLSVNHVPLECTNLTELVNELLEDFELLIQEKRAEINIGELPCIDLNKGQIRQVFQNIISNALKFSRQDKPPVITITSKRIREKSFDSPEQADGLFCLISIQDNGIGFDEQYISNIFSLFERLHSKDKYEGAGIGLAIAKKIIDKHNGLITATSKEGSGALFKIILPISGTQL